MAQRSKIQTVSGTVVIANGGTTANSADFPGFVNGLVRGIYINAPTITGATYTFAVTGPQTGQTLYSKASLTPNAKTNILIDANNYPLQIPVDGACTVTVTSAGTEGAARTFSFSLLVDKGN